MVALLAGSMHLLPHPFQTLPEPPGRGCSFITARGAPPLPGLSSLQTLCSFPIADVFSPGTQLGEGQGTESVVLSGCWQCPKDTPRIVHEARAQWLPCPGRAGPCWAAGEGAREDMTVAPSDVGGWLCSATHLSGPLFQPTMGCCQQRPQNPENFCRKSARSPLQARTGTGAGQLP